MGNAMLQRQTQINAPLNGSDFLSLPRLVERTHICSLAQPSLKRVQHTQDFFFQDATVLLILSGQLDVRWGEQLASFYTGNELLMVDAGTTVSIVKTPAKTSNRFRSCFLSIAPGLVNQFRKNTTIVWPATVVDKPYRTVALTEELGEALSRVCQNIASTAISDERLQYRLLDLLTGLAEEGGVFSLVNNSTVTAKVRALLVSAPDQTWTAPLVGKSLAMSEATLRRKLASEATRFEVLLTDVRMHHALMLLQTTSLPITHIAEMSGYKSRARFSERFLKRFGYSPIDVR